MKQARILIINATIKVFLTEYLLVKYVTCNVIIETPKNGRFPFIK